MALGEKWEERRWWAMWTLDNLEDGKCDLSVFHRVDDILAIPGATLFPRVERLGAYAGVVARRVEITQSRETSVASRSSTAPAARNNVPESVMLSEHEAAGWAERV